MARPVLVINSYAGSLTIAARSLDLDVIGSYEDAGFGIKIQKKNFPELDYVDTLPWPHETKLKGAVVIAHPPCSGFSIQTKANVKIHGHDLSKIHGTTSDAFQCATRIMKYSMERSAHAVIIESVVPAMEGAREVHDKVAGQFGYNAFRILQNSVTFGVPQWRERFWIVFMKQNSLKLRYSPVIRNIREAFVSDMPVLDTRLARQATLLTEMGMRASAVTKLLMGPPYGKVSGILKMDRETMARWCVNGRYQASIHRVLDPLGFCPTVMADSHWIYEGRPVSLENYRRAMGFPAEYQMPKSDHNKYLSKGVCPSVAQWLLRNIALEEGLGDRFEIEAGGLLDLRIKKSELAFL